MTGVKKLKAEKMRFSRNLLGWFGVTDVSKTVKDGFSYIMATYKFLLGTQVFTINQIK